MEILDGVLAYRLLNSANLTREQKQLVKATVCKMDYDIMKDQLKKVFTSATGDLSPIDDRNESKIKVDSSQGTSDVFYNKDYSNPHSYRWKGRGISYRGNYKNHNASKRKDFKSNEKKTKSYKFQRRNFKM